MDEKEFLAEVSSAYNSPAKTERGFKPSAPADVVRPQPVPVPEPTRPNPPKSNSEK